MCITENSNLSSVCPNGFVLTTALSARNNFGGNQIIRNNEEVRTSKYYKDLYIRTLELGFFSSQNRVIGVYSILIFDFWKQMSQIKTDNVFVEG